MFARPNAQLDRDQAALVWKARINLEALTGEDLGQLLYSTRPYRYFQEEPELMKVPLVERDDFYDCLDDAFEVMQEEVMQEEAGEGGAGPEEGGSRFGTAQEAVIDEEGLDEKDCQEGEYYEEGCAGDQYQEEEGHRDEEDEGKGGEEGGRTLH